MERALQTARNELAELITRLATPSPALAMLATAVPRVNSVKGFIWTRLMH